MRIVNDHPYPLRVLVLAVDAHENEAVARHAAAMARGLAREKDDVYLAIAPSGWCTPFERDEPMQFVAWLAPPASETAPGTRREQRTRIESVEATRALVRAVHPECVLFVASHVGHGVPLLEGVAAAGVPTAVVVMDAHQAEGVNDARPIFLRRLSCAHQWAATSAHAQRVLARRLGCPPGAIEVAPEGVRLQAGRSPQALAQHRLEARAALHVPADACVIMAQGRMTEESGCLDWAEAIAGVARDIPDAAFVWLGAGPLRTSVTAILHDSPAASRVRIVRDGNAPPDLHLAADIAVFPARTPRPGLEIGAAMAAGIPIIATAVDPIPELVRPMRDGLVCAKANPASLADALRYAVHNPAALRAMASAAYLRIQDYSEERAVHALRPLLERLSLLRGEVRMPGQRP